MLQTDETKRLGLSFPRATLGTVKDAEFTDVSEFKGSPRSSLSPSISSSFESRLVLSRAAKRRIRANARLAKTLAQLTGVPTEINSHAFWEQLLDTGGTMKA